MTEQIKNRTKHIGIEIIKFIDDFPQKTSAWAIAKQLIRCATSIGANYRAACRAKSPADFINKLKIVEEEADETLYWLEIIEESNLMSGQQSKIVNLKSETGEILSIIVASIKTANSKIINRQSKIVNPKSSIQNRKS